MPLALRARFRRESKLLKSYDTVTCDESEFCVTNDHQKKNQSIAKRGMIAVIYNIMKVGRDYAAR